jgi:hypothetical protein
MRVAYEFEEDEIIRAHMKRSIRDTHQALAAAGFARSEHSVKQRRAVVLHSVYLTIDRDCPSRWPKQDAKFHDAMLTALSDGTETGGNTVYFVGGHEVLVPAVTLV